MADARVEAVETFVQAWNRRDLDAALALVGEEFEYVNPPNAVEPGTRSGTEGVTTVLTKQWEGLGDARMVIAQTHLRDDHVITVVQLSRGMPGSVARIENQAVLRWTFDGERMTRTEVLGAGSSFNDALAEAGIEAP